MIRADRRSSGASKGQMFLIGAVIVVVALVLIKTSINVAGVLEKKKFLEAGVERAEFSNIRGEVSKAAFNAKNYTLNMTNVTNGFIGFAESKLAGRTMQLDGATVDSAYGNLTASVNVPLNVTFYNFFDVDVNRVVLNLSTDFNSPVSFAAVPPGSTVSTQFTLNIGSSRNLTLWVFYETATESVQQNVTIPADVNSKTKFVGYFDLRMNSERGSVRDRFSETVNVN